MFCICSDLTKFHSNFLKRVFRKNDYPENFIDKCFKKFLDNIHHAEENVTTVEKMRLLQALCT